MLTMSKAWAELGKKRWTWLQTAQAIDGESPHSSSDSAVMALLIVAPPPFAAAACCLARRREGAIDMGEKKRDALKSEQQII